MTTTDVVASNAGRTIRLVDISLGKISGSTRKLADASVRSRRVQTVAYPTMTPVDATNANLPISIAKIAMDLIMNWTKHFALADVLKLNHQLAMKILFGMKDRVNASVGVERCSIRIKPVQRRGTWIHALAARTRNS